MSADDRVRAFVALAHEELEAARVLAKVARRQAAYYLHQSVEKTARAILTRAGIEFGTGHNLGMMAGRLPADHPFRSRIMEFDRLSAASTKYRYPTPTGRLPEPPSTAAIEKDIVAIAKLLDDVERFTARSA